MNWIPFFSQTGSEIANIIEKTKIEPIFIVTNRKDFNFDERLKKYNILFFNNFKELVKIKNILLDSVVTLHGFLKIIPSYLITENMYNGHPGLITKYPELKGFNPQEKAFNLNLKTSGSVIHRVVEEVDSGAIILENEVSIENLNLDEVYIKLKENSLDLWIKFFKGIK